MIEKRNEIEIRGHIEVLWGILSDWENYSDWNPLIYRIDGKMVIGNRIIIHVKNTKEDRTFRCKVSRVNKSFLFAWKFSMPLPFLYRGENIFSVESIDERNSRFIDREVFKGLLARHIVNEPPSTRSEGMIALAEALKLKVEGSPG